MGAGHDALLLVAIMRACVRFSHTIPNNNLILKTMLVWFDFQFSETHQSEEEVM